MKESKFKDLGIRLAEASRSAGISIDQLSESLNNFKRQAIINKNKHKSIYHN